MVLISKLYGYLIMMMMVMMMMMPEVIRRGGAKSRARSFKGGVLNLGFTLRGWGPGALSISRFGGGVGG